MRHLFWIPAILVALAVPAVVLAGSGNGFDGVVNSIESRYSVHAHRIPFMGLISFIARRATHGEVGGVHVAEFEHFDKKVDGHELDRMVSKKVVGHGWERVIRETRREGGDQTLVFMRKEGKHMGLFVVDLDGHEMNVVQVSVDPEFVEANIQDFTPHHSRHSRRETSD